MLGEPVLFVAPPSVSCCAPNLHQLEMSAVRNLQMNIFLEVFGMRYSVLAMSPSIALISYSST
jgi:hypothetical protein